MAGNFTGTTDFDPNNGVVLDSAESWGDCFIVNLTLDGDFNWVKKFGGDRTDRLYTMTTDLNGNIYFGGIFEDSLDIDPGANEEWLVHVGMENEIPCAKPSSGAGS